MKQWMLQATDVVHVCGACGKKNRVPVEHLTHTGKCGACGARLPPLDVPLDVNGDTFDRVIQGAKAPVLVDFWAAWCMPCRMAAPEVAKTAKLTAGRGIVLEVDTEQNPQLAARYQIRGIPSFMVFDRGAVAHQQSGLTDHRTMTAWLTERLTA